MVSCMHLCTCEACTQQLQEQNKSCFGVPALDVMGAVHAPWRRGRARRWRPRDRRGPPRPGRTGSHPPPWCRARGSPPSPAGPAPHRCRPEVETEVRFQGRQVSLSHQACCGRMCCEPVQAAPTLFVSRFGGQRRGAPGVYMYIYLRVAGAALLGAILGHDGHLAGVRHGQRVR